MLAIHTHTHTPVLTMLTNVVLFLMGGLKGVQCVHEITLHVCSSRKQKTDLFVCVCVCVSGSHILHPYPSLSHIHTHILSLLNLKRG